MRSIAGFLTFAAFLQLGQSTASPQRGHSSVRVRASFSAASAAALTSARPLRVGFRPQSACRAGASGSRVMILRCRSPSRVRSYARIGRGTSAAAFFANFAAYKGLLLLFGMPQCDCETQGSRCCMEDCSGGLLERIAQHGSQKDCSEGAQNDAQSGAQMVCSNGSHIPHTRVSSVGCMESGWAQGWHSGVLVGNLHTTWQGLQAIVRVLVRWNGLARGDSGSRGRCAELCVHCWPHGVCW